MARAYQSLVRSFLQVYPGEAATHLNHLSSRELLELLQLEPVEVWSKVFLRLKADVSANLIREMEEGLFVDLFSIIDPSKGATVLARLDAKAVNTRLTSLPEKLRNEYHELMSYPLHTAGHLMDPRVLGFLRSERVEQVLDRIRSIRDFRIIDVCVVDEDGKLVGTVPLQRIAVVQPSELLGELIERDPIAVNVMDPREDVVKLLEDRKLASLPVTHLDGRLAGIIRYDGLVSAAQQEASQDVQSMFGAGRDERALSKPSFAFRKRLPWLEINLATAFLAAAVVGLFEDTIARFTVLAIFLPVVAGQSGNTGSQALAVTMRGLALREIRPRHWLGVAGKEMLVGCMNGCVLAITTAVAVYLWMSSLTLATVIGISMLFSMIIASLAGALIPISLQAMGEDPAQSSSIVLTTVTDVVGFLSFLGLAALVSKFVALT